MISKDACQSSTSLKTLLPATLIKRENAGKELETLNSAILVSDQDNWYRKYCRHQGSSPVKAIL